MGYVQIKQTAEEVENVIDMQMHPFHQDIADSTHTIGSPQAITANDEYLFTIDALLRNQIISPTYFTDRWDTINNKMTFITEIDTPTYVADLSFIFDPSTAAAGKYTIRLYIDDSTPKEIRVYSGAYKAVAEIHNQILTWYLGTETGYDAKNDGVFFTIQFDSNGDLYNKGAVIYRT